MSTLLLLVCMLGSGGWLLSVHAQEYPSFDGFYHNMHYPDWGSIETPFLRMGGGVLYSDASYEMLTAGRPNPRVLSNALFATPPSTASLPSLRNVSALAVFFGQQVFAEMHNGLQQGCPVEYVNIDIPKCDPVFDPQCTGTQHMPFSRSRYVSTSGQGPSAPRQQLNENSAWLDGGSIYGNGKTWTDKLRAESGGLLKSMPGSPLFPSLNDVGLPFVNVPPPTDNPGPGRIRHPKTRSVDTFLRQ